MNRVNLVLLVLFIPLSAAGLVSEGRPGIPYANHLLFLDTKQVRNGQVTQVRLAYRDTRSAAPDCLNTIDVFQGLELFAPAQEKSWVLVDYELQSILVESGFFGDADVFKVRACGSLEACAELREKLEQDLSAQATSSQRPRSGDSKSVFLSEIEQQLDIGRKLIKAARCRGCHQVEGYGAEHAPSLTWKRHKYVKDWLEEYLRNPYRLRPAIDDLMMLQYTSPNARPSLQALEVAAVAGFLEEVAKASSPSGNFRNEAWQRYDCFTCHASNYLRNPLRFIPTAVPRDLRQRLQDSVVMTSCLVCHAFGDYRQVTPAGRENDTRFAPDLLLAMEKLDIDYLLNYVQRPSYLQPGSKMPPLTLIADQQLDLRRLVMELRRRIETGNIKPVHNYYRMNRNSD